MNRKPSVLQQLNLIPVYFNDESETSPDWFQISNFPLRLTSGKNLFKLRGHPTNLKIGANIDFEVLDYNGDPIYAELVNYIDEDDSRIIAIYIYEDTSPGDCTITIIGSAADEFVTEEWFDRYNVKWSRTVAVNPGTPNVSEIIFDTKPEVTVAELIAPQLNRTYANNLQTASYSTGTVRYFNYNEQPALELSNGFFTSDMSNGTITVSNPVLPLPAIDFVVSSSTYVSSIKKILTPTTALLNTAYQVTDTQNILNHTYNTFALSSYALTYEATPIYTPTQNSHSFLDLKINKLEPATGDISRIKVFSNNSGTIGTWELINDIELEKTEIFETTTGSIYPIPPIGVFNKQDDIDVYWDGQAFAGPTTLASPTLTYTTASILNAMTISSSINLSNKNTVLVAKIKSAYAGTFAEKSSYKLTLDAAGIKTGSESPILSIYVSGSSFYQDTTDYFNQEFPYKFGKRIGELQTLVSNQKFNEHVIDFEADYSGTGVLILVVESGNWHVSNIHVTSNNDPGFSPNYTRIKSLVPTTHKSNNQLSFKVEYYNVQGEKSKYISYVNDNNWEGGNHYIDGDYSMLTGSMWVGDSLGTGIGITGNQNAGHVMSAGYEGFNIGKPGFLMWSGSVLPGKLSKEDPYSGVGLELYQDPDNYFRYSTKDSELDIRTKTFFLGSPSSSYIEGFINAGDSGSLIISSSNFVLDEDGDVLMAGTINATAGNIGGFTIFENFLLNDPNFYLQGDATGDDFFISSSKFNVKASGDITGSNVLFTGGKIAGFTISDSTLSNGTNFFISGAAQNNDFFISSSKFNVKANGNITASSALFSGSVSVTGNINATTGNIGGFAITRDAITGSGVLISGSATSGTQFFISSSKFNVKGNGDVTGSNVLFTGGKIAGFTISDNTLSNANNFYISGSATVNDFFISSSKFNVKGNGDITGSSVLFTAGKIGSFTLTNNALSGISSGATTFLISSSVDASNLSTAFFISSSKFNVRQDGTVSGSQVFFDGGKIGGFTIDSSKITGTNIVIDSAGSIQTSDYASDLKGWKISAMSNGYAEFENARIRGTLKTAVFEKETVNAVGGQLYVANSSTITGSEATTSIPQIAYLKFGGYSGSNAIQNIAGSTSTYLTLASLATASIKNLPTSTQTFKPIGGTGLLIASGSKAIASVANTSVASLAGTPSTALSNYTVMAWVRPDFSSYTTSKPSGSIIEKSGSVSSLSGPFFLGFNVESANTASFIYSTGNNANTVLGSLDIGTNALRTNTWTHVALVGRTTGPFERTPYINGVSGSTSITALANAPAINTSPINLGVGQTYTERFPGYIADVRVYNVALTNAEIAAIYSGSYFTGSIASNTPSLQIDNVTGFVNGEILSAKKISNTGFATEYFQVRDTMRLLPSSETDFSGVLYVTRSYGNGLAGDSGSLGNSPSTAQSYEPAQVIVSTGKLGTGFIRINANPNDENTPYIDIVERTGSGIYDVALKARLGDLSGLANSSYVFGKSDPGFGLATDNVFLQGGIIANTGSIGGINMASSKLFTGTTGTYNNPDTGFYLDNAGKFSLKDKLAWDGDTLSIVGQIQVSNGSFVPGSSIYQHGPLTYWPRSKGQPPQDLTVLPNAYFKDPEDNAIEYVMGPFGTQELAITCYPNSGNYGGPPASPGWHDGDGGFNSESIPIDSGSAYMFVVYMKRTTNSTSGLAYFGLDGYNAAGAAIGVMSNNVTPTINTNPYFMYGDITPAGETDAASSLDRWMLHVGYVYPSGSAYNANATNIVYDLTTGLTASYSYPQPTYTWQTGTTATIIRAYHFYNEVGDDNTKYQEIARPGIFKMDGTEPTIQSLLSNTSAGGSTKIDGSTITTGKIRSNNWSATLGSELNLNEGTITLGGYTSTKFNVNASGDVTASSALFSGSVSVTGNINATTGNIGGFAITRDAITGSGVLISGSATGGTQFFISSSKFNVKGNGDVTGSNVLFTGGNIAGFTISDSTLSNGTNFYISGSATGGTQFFISSSKFNVKGNGDVTASSALFSGSVSVTGNINATTGNIGGFAITRDAITGSGVLISGSATGGTQFFISASKFNVKGNGDLTGSNVLFTGGRIGGFTIGANNITATGLTLTAGTTPSIALGNATSATSGKGIWLGSDTTGDFRVGDPTTSHIKYNSIDGLQVKNGDNILFNPDEGYIDALNVGRVLYFNRQQMAYSTNFSASKTTASNTMFETFILPGETKIQSSFMYEFTSATTTGAVRIQYYIQSGSTSAYDMWSNPNYGAPQPIVSNLTPTTYGGHLNLNTTLNIAPYAGKYVRIYGVISRTNSSTDTLVLKGVVYRSSRELGSTINTTLPGGYNPSDAPATPSDIRLKTNINKIGVSNNGITIYEFKYINQPNDLYQGVIAQELIGTKFELAVGIGSNGYYNVDYSKLDVDFKKINQTN